MARKEREAIAVVLDIGRSVSEEKDHNGKSYLDRARSCASMIVQRKLFSQSNDLLGLLLLGSRDTNNSLDYASIEVQFPMNRASWDMLEFLEKGVKPTNINADWLDAIVVGMQFIKDELDGSMFPISAKKLIIFTNFSTPVSDDQVNIITNGLKNLEIELIIIGPNVIPGLKTEDLDTGMGPSDNITNGSQSHKTLKTNDQASGEALISKIVTDVGGVICSFDDAVPQLQYFETKKTKPAPWHVVMDVGPDINIPVTGFKKIANVPLPTWKTASANLETGIESERSYFKQDAEQKVVTKEDVIDGYTFGSTIVPFSGVDQKQLQYESGKRCLSVIGTTDATNVPRHLLVGDGCYNIIAQKDDPAAAVALSAFIVSLHDEKMVAIARRVYNNNNAPVLAVLYPKVRPDYECLVLVDLPYAVDVKYFKFPSLKNFRPTDEQLECVDNLIDNMDLMTAVKNEDDEPSEAFHPKRNLNPYHQHFYQALCDKGLNPDAPLPPAKQTTLDLLATPYKNDPVVQKALSEVKKKFQLTVIKQKEPRKTAADIFKQDDVVLQGAGDAPNADTGPTTMAEITARPVVQIGTINPVKDFRTMLEGDLSFRQVATEMGEVISNLVLRSFGSDDFDKAVSALQVLRETCLAKDTPDLFNNWMVEFKGKILARGKRPFWDLVATEKLGQITSTETASSAVNAETAAEFLTVAAAVSVDQDQDQYMDVEDLLDEM